jgi:proteasome lid subunit RPN8/RPN11
VGFTTPEEETIMQSTQIKPATYRFRLEFWDRRPRRIHELALAPDDFSRAVEAVFFDGLKRGLYTEYDPPLADARLEPRFAAGSPFATGFQVVLPTPAGGEHRGEFGIDFFNSQASRISADLVRSRQLPNNSLVVCQLSAYLDEADETSDSGMRIEPPSVAVPLRPGAIADFGPAVAWDNPRPAEHRVLIPRHVLEEAVDEAKRAPKREVGGVLLGHLRRDPATGEVFLEITCQVPAEETEATELSVTFTPATWARVREVVDLRGEGEIFAGWVHSHPFGLCADCPLTPPPECVDKVLFYSTDDDFLMELSFARPFMVGLLTAAEPRLERALGHLPVRLFGWRNGTIQRRGFEVIE